jgi:hypothetical protein
LEPFSSPFTPLPISALIPNDGDYLPSRFSPFPLIDRSLIFDSCINDVGLTLTLLAPLTGSCFLVTACIGSICTAICGVAAGSTKAAITQHFTRQKTNSALVADIHAKESTQETIVSVLGLILGSMLSYALDESLLLRWSVFFSLTVFHVLANYYAVTVLCLTTLNNQRASILIKHYVLFKTVLDPGEVSRRELVWRRPAPHGISIGVPLHSLV